MQRPIVTAALLALLPCQASAQRLLVCESTNARVMLFDSTDGSLIDDRFIELAWLGGITPIEAQVVSNEIWVTDRDADAIFRFGLDGGAHLGTIQGAAAGLDDVRGAAVANGRFYVANGGTLNGAPGQALVIFDFTGARLGHFFAADPFDVIDFDGRVLTTNGSEDALEAHAYSGLLMVLLHDSDGVTGIDFPHQATLLGGGHLLVAGSDDPDRLYEYDALGHELQRWDVAAIGGQGAPRGVQELGNGRILFTNAAGVHVLDTAGPGVTTVVSGVDAQYVGLLGTLEPGVAFCAGDGTGAPCPCGNLGGPAEGCANSTGSGAELFGSGSVSVAADDLRLHGRGLVPGQPGLYLQGDNAIAGGAGIAFGDGLRCAGGNVVRLRILSAGPLGTSRTSLDIAATGGVAAGDTRRYQLWYRDPAGSPCGVGFNLTNGYEVTWLP